MGRLDGRVAIVTGGAKNIGAAYAKGLAAEGAAVAVADVDDPTNTVNIIRQQGGRALGLRTDVTDAGQVAEMAARTEAEFGKIDVLVNNAGLYGILNLKPFTEISEDEWDRVMRVNVRGIFQCCKAVVPIMRKRKYGKIVNISSGTVLAGIPMYLHYVTSKGAVIALTRALARELGADNICVNTLAPGLTSSGAEIEKTQAQLGRVDFAVNQRAFKRVETPDDLVGACIFLASPESDFMTGQMVNVDGGAAMY
jgi:NAD(P)-dependent dehydrogenase (short-subunit alcohol dehydrogenase family)